MHIHLHVLCIPIHMHIKCMHTCISNLTPRGVISIVIMISFNNFFVFFFYLLLGTLEIRQDIWHCIDTVE